MPRGRKKKQDNKKLNITIVVLLLISVLLAVVIYTKDSYLGNHLSPALGGVFGHIKYVLPVGLLAMTIYIAYKKEVKPSTKIILFLIALLIIETISATYQISEGKINPKDDFNTVTKIAFELGCKDIGGGVLGTSVATMFVNILGTTGTVILLLVLLLAIGIFLFDLNPSEIITNCIEKIKTNREKKNKYKQEAKTKEEVQEVSVESWLKRIKQKQDNSSKKPLEEQITINIKENKKNEEAEKPIEVPNFKINTRKTKIEGEDKAKADMFEQEEIEKEAKTKQVLQLEHTLTEAEINYEFPPIQLLEQGNGGEETNSKKALLATAEKLRKTLQSFGVSAKVENVSVGPAITRYELSPAEGVRVSKIANLADDIALSLEAETIRIEAPIPGKHTVGIEVPNKTKSVVALRDIIETHDFTDSKSKLAFALGKDVAGDIVVTDVAKMPHLLIAGSTGSGKSVCINTLITSIIYKAKPSEVKLLMIDPKVVELSVYNGIPHLLIPVVTDPKKAAGALAWTVQEMVNRYSLFAQKNVRDIKGYNEVAEKAGESKLPQIVIIIDELADLMMVAAKDVEDAICRLAQMARAAGMHLVIATQRPSVDVITGIIKANIPSRIAFAVSSQVDSRTILDSAGAEKLLGKGDMLFFPSGTSKPTRIQGAFVSDKEVENIVKYIRTDNDNVYDERIIESIENSGEPEKVKQEDDDDETDDLLEEAIELVISNGQASTSGLQRRLKIGYARAGRLIDQMEERGIVSGFQGSKPREVLMTKERWEELKMAPSSTAQNNDSQDEESNETKNI